jgi:DNA-binding response OmpR family regulator
VAQQAALEAEQYRGSFLRSFFRRLIVLNQRVGLTEMTFGPFRLDFDHCQLTPEGNPIVLGSRAIDLLCVLAAARRDLVTHSSKRIRSASDCG